MSFYGYAGPFSRMTLSVTSSQKSYCLARGRWYTTRAGNARSHLVLAIHVSPNVLWCFWHSYRSSKPRKYASIEQVVHFLCWSLNEQRLGKRRCEDSSWPWDLGLSSWQSCLSREPTKYNLQCSLQCAFRPRQSQRRLCRQHGERYVLIIILFKWWNRVD